MALALSNSLPLFQLVFITFLLLSCFFLYPGEHRPLSNPQSRQEHGFTHLYPFAVHHQVVRKWNQPSHHLEISPKGHSQLVLLHTVFSGPSSRAARIHWTLSSGPLHWFICKPVWCLLASAPTTPRSHCPRCFVTNSLSLLRLLTYAFPSIHSCFCWFCFHFVGSVTFWQLLPY